MAAAPAKNNFSMRKSGLICFAIGLFAAFALQAKTTSSLWLPDFGGNFKASSAAVKKVKTEIIKSDSLGRDGFVIERKHGKCHIYASQKPGLMYGRYELNRLALSGETDTLTRIVSRPAFDLRILNHWDNLDGTVERGYAGHSIWQWDELPQHVSPLYRQYAEACASVGINGIVLNNVNASPKILSDEYLPKVAKIADELRKYNIKVYLSVNFASPMSLGGLKDADPLDADVISWWQSTVNKIYTQIPDFGGFLVKANSEGQPGPCDYGRSHAEGANMLAKALKPYGGIVMWRAFVYSPIDADRAKQAFIEFQPLDGQFDYNVIIQIKNGPIDFQPREPYSPLFGAMPRTQQMVEFQITQEYLGHSNHLAFLAPMWREFFDYVEPSSLRAVAGVANVGDAANWTGHPFGQANLYAFGRLAWDPELTSEEIAREWSRQTLGRKVPETAENELVEMMCGSREAVVNYMMPLGLHHLFAWGHHYGPEPWCDIAGARPDWMPRYYHRADSVGLGFDRSKTGSDAVSQYPTLFCEEVNNLETCPDEFVLWFHHVAWNHRLHSGRTLWQELCHRYDIGVKYVGEVMIPTWQLLRGHIDNAIFDDVNRRLQTQYKDARWWKDACLLYFGQFSQQPIPDDIEQPTHTLEQLQKVNLGITNYECPSAELLDSLR
jgi:alpha-glucuronidase